MAAAPPVLSDVVRLFVRHPLRWLVPAVLTAVAVAAYAAWRTDVWEASLALVVRAEASGNADGAGRFRHLAEMKTLEETLLEIGKSREVLTSVLRRVGPSPATEPAAAWPSPSDVDDLADVVKPSPPKGAELGATEVFYLKVRDPSPERAAALADAVADEMIARFRQLRDDKARSMVDELTGAVETARREVVAAVGKLSDFEGRIGADLAELRNLESQNAGDGDLRKLSVELENELRQAERSAHDYRELLELLAAVQADPTRLPAMSNRLLESQPAVRRLKDGIVDAQLRTSHLLGSMSREHPLVRAALDAETEADQRLHDELATAVVGVRADLAMAEDLAEQRRRQLSDVRRRLDRLVAARAEYSALNAETQYRTRQWEQAEKQLADARAAQAGIAASTLVSRVDRPDVGSKPVGPGKSVLFAAGAAGGLVIGIGVLLLTTRLPQSVPSADEAFVTAAAAVSPLIVPVRKASRGTAEFSTPVDVVSAPEEVF